MATDKFLIAFDVETTGLSPADSAITEIGAVKCTLRGEVVSTFKSFANPGHPIPANIVELTGINDGIVASAPPSHVVVEKWFHWVGSDALLLAHNAPFDVKFVCASLLKAGITSVPLQVVDTLEWVKKCSLPVMDNKLTTILGHIGYKPPASHRAVDDAYSVLIMTRYLLKTYEKPTSDESLWLCLRKLAAPINTLLPAAMKKQISSTDGLF